MLTDYSLCLQSDMQRGVHGRLMDNSTSVREAAVELLGKFVLSRPQLTEQYYDMLIERILVSCPVSHLFPVMLWFAYSIGAKGAKAKNTAVTSHARSIV